MKSGIFEKSFSKKPLFLILYLIILNFSCAVVPGLDSHRIDTIAKGPEFAPFTGLKRRIAVLNFENNSQSGGKKLGSAVSDLLISQLKRSDRFILIERSRIETILKEQALGQSGAITEETVAQVGKLLGVESIVFGKILEAEQRTGSRKIDDKKNEWSLALKTIVGKIHISYRMVDTSTGEIILANDFTKTEMKPGFGIKTKEFDFENMFEFDQTILGIATRIVVNKIVLDIVNNLNKIDWVGKIVQSKADTLVYFTPGRGAGVQLNQLFEIYGKIEGKEETELQIEELIYQDQPKANIKVTGFIGDRVARAKVITGENIKRGDLVKLVKHSP